MERLAQLEVGRRVPAHAEGEQRREHVDEDRRHFVERMEDERVAPRGDGHGERAGGVEEIDEEEALGGGEEEELGEARGVRPIAEVDQKVLPTERRVDVGAQHQQRHNAHGVCGGVAAHASVAGGRTHAARVGGRAARVGFERRAGYSSRGRRAGRGAGSLR